jgi:hypothetical protein
MSARTRAAALQIDTCCTVGKSEITPPHHTPYRNLSHSHPRRILRVPDLIFQDFHGANFIEFSDVALSPSVFWPGFL